MPSHSRCTHTYYVSLCVCLCVRACVCVCVRICMCAYLYVYVSTYCIYMYVWVGGWERACMYMHIMCVIVYSSNCDDIDISNGVITTHRYGTIFTMLS